MSAVQGNFGWAANRWKFRDIILRRFTLNNSTCVYRQKTNKNIIKMLYGGEHPLQATVRSKIRRITCISGLFYREETRRI